MRKVVTKNLLPLLRNCFIVRIVGVVPHLKENITVHGMRWAAINLLINLTRTHATYARKSFHHSLT